MKTPRSTFAYRVALRSILIYSFLWVLFSIDILGMGDRANRYSQDLLNIGFGDILYPACDFDVDRNVQKRCAQHQISVLLLTDQYLNARHQGRWPISYDAHGKILNNLRLFNPKGVFIDFLWLNRQKPGKEYLLRVLRRYKEDGIEVYMAFRKDSDLQQIWPELDGLVIPVAANIVYDPVDFVARTYTRKVGELPSAAFAMYDQNHTFSRDMDIFWGTSPSYQNQAWMTRPAEKAELDTAKSKENQSLLFDGVSAISTTLPYSTTVFVRDLMHPVGENDEAAVKDLGNHLTGRYVMYGANLSGVSDLVFTPTRQIRPGVYYHAMALDNLLSLQQNYKSSELVTPFPGWVLDLIILFPSALLLVWHLEARKSDSGAYRLPRYLYLFPLIWVPGWCAVLIFHYNLSAPGWLGYLSFLTFSAVLEHKQLLDKILGYLIARLTSAPRWLLLLHKDGSSQ